MILSDKPNFLHFVSYSQAILRFSWKSLSSLMILKHHHSTCHGPATMPIRGGHSYLFNAEIITPHLVSHQEADHSLDTHSNYKLKYIAHVDSPLSLKYPMKDGFVHLCILLTIIVPHIPITEILKIAKFHKITLSCNERLDRQKLVNHFINHSCINCNLYKSIFSVVYGKVHVIRKQVCKQPTVKVTIPTPTSTHRHKKTKEIASSSNSCSFPPPPLSHDLAHRIIYDFCHDILPNNFEESGCAVCG